MATKSPRYYQLRKACKVVRKVRKGAPLAFQYINEMRVREYASFFRCGLAEFGLANDPAARAILAK